MVAAQKLIRSARPESERRGQVRQPGLTEVHQVSGDLGGLAGQHHRSEQGGHLALVFPEYVGQPVQRLGILNPADKHLKLAPVQALAQRHQVEQHLLERLRAAAAIGLTCPRDHGVAQTRRQAALLQQQSADGYGRIEGLPRRRLGRGENDGVNQVAAAQQPPHRKRTWESRRLVSTRG